MKQYTNFTREELIGEILSLQAKSTDEATHRNEKNSNKTLKFYQKIFADSPIGMTICDTSGQCVEANESIAKIIGAKKEQVLAQNYYYIESWKQNGLLETAKSATKTINATNKKITLTSTFGKLLTANIHFLPFSLEENSYLLCIFDDISDMKKVEDERDEFMLKLQNALSELKILRGILPICSYCKKIRDDDGYWRPVEVYIHKYSEADCSHGICQDCLKEHHPEEYEEILSRME